MGQIISARQSSKRKRELEYEHQNDACKVVVLGDPNKDVQSNLTTTSNSSSAATPTLPSSYGSNWDYDVFLSFRGEDTRKNFTDHLYSALGRVGIRTFRDDEELQRGKTISNGLLNAIRGSRISIVVFSKGYASSKWCLDELVEIVHCKNTIGHTILPIFYHMDPSDVRKQTGTFAEAFARYEELFHTNMERVQSWRAALTEVANCSGFDLESVANGYESRFIEVIVEEVLCKVNHDRLNVAKHPIGIDSRVEEVKILLNLETRAVHIVGIYGMGGVGKTTLANAVYNEICVAFEGSSFLSNLKESSEQPNGLIHLQEQLLYDILKTNLKIDNVDKGIILIKERLHRKRVLVILDDVDDFEKLQTLVEKKWLGPGSRIIVTTRDENLLSQLGVDEKYKVRELNHWESLRLFNWHAFEMASPKGDYSKLSLEAVDYAGGLPLALVVLGSFLKGRSIVEWESELKKLRRTPHNKIQNILRISFDSLDNSTKDIFLDIASFFIGMDKEYVIKILDGCNFSPGIGIFILLQMSLLIIDDQSKLKMHNLIRNMGREIVYEESPKYPGKRSRLWLYDDVLGVLHKHTGSKAVEGLSMYVPYKVPLKTETFVKMKNLRLLQINSVSFSGSYEHLSKELKWLCWHKCPLDFLPLKFHLENLIVLDIQHSNVKQLWEEENKKTFNKLKVLNLSNCKYINRSTDFSQVPQLEILILEGCTSLVQVHESIGCLKRLVSLNLKNCTNLKDLPRSIYNLESLETLDLSGCSALEKLPEQLENMMDLMKLLMDDNIVKQLSSSFGVFKNLTSISFYRCSRLTKLPNFLQAPHLVNLVIEGCTSLVQVHESIGYLKRLVTLNLKDCKNLKDLPKSIFNLESLETFDLSCCSALEKVPDQFENMMDLTKLLMDENVVNQLSSSFGIFKNLTSISFYGCSCLTKLPNFLQAPHLERLVIEGCTSLAQVHESIGCLKRLVTLNLRDCKNIKNLPTSIFNLESLETLNLSCCSSLEKVPDQFENMMALTKLHMDGNYVKQLPSSLCVLKNLKVVSFYRCSSLTKLPNFLQAPHLETLIVSGCTSLVEIPESIGCLKRLVKLSICNCRNLKDLPRSICNLESLKTLAFSDCVGLDKLPEQLGSITTLKYLFAMRIAIKHLPASIGLLRNLKTLGLSRCGGPSSSQVSSKSSNNMSLLPSISGLSSLTKLNISDRCLCEDGIPIELGCLSSLKSLSLSRYNFRNLPSCINCLTGLQDLYLNECINLQSISLPIGVKGLRANGCTSLERILTSANESFRSFSLNNCHKLVEIRSLKSLQPQSYLCMGMCNNLSPAFRESVLQMMCKAPYGCSLCLPGSEIPNWISHQTIGSLLSFRLPSFLDVQIGNVLVCLVYATTVEGPLNCRKLGHEFRLTFCNKTQNPRKSYSYGINTDRYFESFEDHIFVQVLRFDRIERRLNKMKSGDEIELSVAIGDLDEVKKCGIHLLLDEPNVTDDDISKCED